jgi:hypothetical protein
MSRISPKLFEAHAGLSSSNVCTCWQAFAYTSLHMAEHYCQAAVRRLPELSQSERSARGRFGGESSSHEAKNRMRKLDDNNCSIISRRQLCQGKKFGVTRKKENNLQRREETECCDRKVTFKCALKRYRINTSRFRSTCEDVTESPDPLARARSAKSHGRSASTVVELREAGCLFSAV